MLELTKREKRLLVIAVMVVMTAGFYLSTNFLLKFLEDLASQRQKIFSEKRMIEQLGQEYHLLQDLARQVNQKTGNTDITPIIEELLNTSQLRGKAASVNPSQSVVDNKYIKYLVQVSLRKVTANEFLSFIRSIETYPGAFLKIDYFNSSLVLKSPGLYNCNIKIATFAAKPK